MEQEVQNILETINKGLQELPSYASEGWDVMIRGIRIDGIISLLMLALLFGVCIAYWVWAFKDYKKYEYEEDFLWINGVMGSVTLILLISSVFIVPQAIRAIITPEYQLLRQFIF